MRIDPSIQHRYNESILLGAHFSDKIDCKLEEQRLTTFAELLRTGGTDVNLVPSIDRERWKKTIW